VIVIYLPKKAEIIGNVTKIVSSLTSNRLLERVGIAAMIAASPTAALAQTDPSQILTAITTFLTGPFGQSLAMLGIIAIGLAWMFGRASLGLIAGVVGGIVIMFGASFLVTHIVSAGGSGG
jgi:type IV secretion system protein VirB2